MPVCSVHAWRWPSRPGHHPIDGFIAHRVRQRVLGTRDVRRGPAVRERAQLLQRLRPEWPELEVLDAPPAGELLDDEL